MAEVFLTRRERFCAAHKLAIPEWSDEKNQEVFGKCANENWHGHNYHLFVTVKGTPDQTTGMVIDLKEMKRIINDKVIDKLDHRNLNLDVDFMSGMVTTAENIAQAIWKELETPLADKGATLHQVRLYETENNIIDYYGN
jgi:6-pyruvoyltetrahydropterin/6-carboxytetrahydropterin synthase